MTGTYGTDDLRRVFAAREADVPDGAGVLAAARTGAAARQRGRRRAILAGTAAAVAAAVATPLVLWQTRPAGGPAPAATAGPGPTGPAGSTGLVVSVGMAPGQGYVVLSSGIIAGAEKMFVRPMNNADMAAVGATVTVYPAGTFDPAPYRSGRKVTVQGREGYFRADVPGASPGRDLPGPAMVWQTASGSWVVVDGALSNGAAVTESAVAALADAVRVGTPHPVAMPFRLSEVPDGLVPKVVRLEGTLANLTFLPVGRPPADYNDLYDAEQQATLHVSASPRGDVDGHLPTGNTPPVRIGDADTWYIEGSRNGVLVLPEGGAGLVVRTSSCVATVTTSDAARLPRAELERLVAGIRFADCADPGTWGPPLPGAAKAAK